MEVDPFNEVANAMKEGDDDEPQDRFKLVISVMVAIAAITIALVAWGSGVISNKSGDESSATIQSAVKAQQADFVLVFEGNLPTQHNSARLLAALRAAQRFGSAVIGIDTGAFALAHFRRRGEIEVAEFGFEAVAL